MAEQCSHPLLQPGEPTLYADWHAWVEEYQKTHRVKKCPVCGLWKIWEPKANA